LGWHELVGAGFGSERPPRCYLRLGSCNAAERGPRGRWELHFGWGRERVQHGVVEWHELVGAGYGDLRWRRALGLRPDDAAERGARGGWELLFGGECRCYCFHRAVEWDDLVGAGLGSERRCQS